MVILQGGIVPVLHLRDELRGAEDHAMGADDGGTEEDELLPSLQLGSDGVTFPAGWHIL